MKKKLGYVLIGGALIVGLQWAVPAAYSAVATDEKAAESCPTTGSCPMKAEKAEV
ncbi:MAG: hypothetical protein ACKVJG_20515 [Candidatus Latescibacterota bacterium]|jgi:hypothetical protein